MSILVPTSKNGDRRLINGGLNLPTWFDDILGDNFENRLVSNYNTGITLPAVNVIDSDNEFIVEMAVPGLNKSDFDIEIDDNILSISVERETNNQEKSETYTRREFGYSSFKRTFSIPKSVDVEKISASYTDGIMKLLLPKLDEAKKKAKRNITIS